MLVGPHARGAIGFVPPGVLCATPRHFDAHFCTGGWREVIWGRDDAGGTLIDLQSPVTLRDVHVLEVADHITVLAPSQRSWLLRQLQLRALSLDNLLVGSLRDADQLRELLQERDTLHIDAGRIAGDAWVRRNLVATPLVAPVPCVPPEREGYDGPPSEVHTIHHR